MFYDLNIKFTETSSGNNFMQEVLEQLLEYGYRGVAIIAEIDDSIFTCKKDKSKKKVATVPKDPIPPLDLSQLKLKYPKLMIYSRINIILSDSDNLHKLQQSKNLRDYDIISCQPENQNVFKNLTSFSNFDIISYNPESKCCLSINRKIYNQFVNQGIFFELVYVPAITNQGSRRNLISLSHIYHAVGKSKNVIVSSGAHLSKYLRGPYDVLNFNLLFGLSEEQAKKAISENCEELILKAKKRRIGKFFVEVSEIKEINQDDEPINMEIDKD